MGVPIQRRFAARPLWTPCGFDLISKADATRRVMIGGSGWRADTENRMSERETPNFAPNIGNKIAAHDDRWFKARL